MSDHALTVGMDHITLPAVSLGKSMILYFVQEANPTFVDKRYILSIVRFVEHFPKKGKTMEDLITDLAVAKIKGQTKEGF